MSLLYPLKWDCRPQSTSEGMPDAARYSAGQRRAEVVALALADYTRETGALTVRQGKGRKDRVTYLPQGVRPIMLQWITLRGEAPDALFWRIRKGSKLGIGKAAELLGPGLMSSQTVYTDAQNLSVRRLKARIIALKGVDLGLSAAGKVKHIEG